MKSCTRAELPSPVSLQTYFTLCRGKTEAEGGCRGGGRAAFALAVTERDNAPERREGRRRPSDDLQGGTAKTFPFLLPPDKNFCCRSRNDINKIMMSGKEVGCCCYLRYSPSFLPGWAIGPGGAGGAAGSPSSGWTKIVRGRGARNLSRCMSARVRPR